MKDRKNIVQLAIPLRFKNMIRITQFTSTLWLFMLMWNGFYRDAATNEKERELMLVCNLKHISCKHFHKIVKGYSIFLRNLQNIHELNRLSK